MASHVPWFCCREDAELWAEEDLRRALVHEIEHVRRADWTVQLMAQATSALYWFNPLVWVAWRKLSLEAERACDDAVLEKDESTAYARQLVSLARRMTRTSAQPAIGMARRSDLSARVRAVLDTNQLAAPQRHRRHACFVRCNDRGCDGRAIARFGSECQQSGWLESWPEQAGSTNVAG